MNIALSPDKKRQFICYIDLIACAVNNSQPPALPTDFDWELICRDAQRNNVLNILAYVLEKLDTKPSQTVCRVMENERRYYILKETSQLVETEKLLQEFEKAEIFNIPLKGYFMKHIYPQTDMRTMTDIDIFVKKDDFKKIEKIFLTQGYTKERVIKSKELIFTKDMLSFEIQSDLNKYGDSYYDNISAKAVRREGYDYSYSLPLEDFYIYMVYHCVNHFKSGGLGIRMLLDIYIFLTAYPNLDFEYILSQLKELKTDVFEARLRSVALNWFSREKTVIDSFGELVLYCGTFGNRDLSFYFDSKRDSRFYMLKQVFIPYSKMKNMYSYVEKHPALLPASWAQYWFTRLFIKRDINFRSGLAYRMNNLRGEDAEFVDRLSDELNIK